MICQFEAGLICTRASEGHTRAHKAGWPEIYGKLDSKVLIGRGDFPMIALS